MSDDVDEGGWPRSMDAAWKSAMRVLRKHGLSADEIVGEASETVRRAMDGRTEPMNISGLWDDDMAPVEMMDLVDDGRDVVLRLYDVSLLGWHVYPYEYRVVGKAICRWDENVWTESVTADRVERHHAPVVRWIAWQLVGRLVWWWQGRRWKEDGDE